MCLKIWLLLLLLLLKELKKNNIEGTNKFMKIFNKIRAISLLVTLLMVVMIAKPTVVMAAEKTVNLGTTSGFAVLAGETITNTGDTTISGSDGGNVGGDVGLYPGSAFTDNGHVSMSDGAVHINDPVAIQAKVDLEAAYDDAARRETTETIGSELGGKTLTPGVYESGAFGITGTLTLDAQGDPDAVFIFKTASTLITAAGSSIKLKNGARFCRTFWKVGSSATLGTNSYFVGHIFALTSIAAKTGAKVQGQLLARNGAVTLDSNTITNGICEVTPDMATLHIIKKVINAKGGTKVAANFQIHVKTSDKDVVASPAPGVEAPGNTYTLVSGNYVISEEDYSGYTASYTGDSDPTGKITLAPGDNKTVIITNTYTPTTIPAPPKATLKVIKHVIGGTKVASDFDINIKTAGNDVAASPAPGSEAGKIYTLDAGDYNISEENYPGYTAKYSGNSDSTGKVTLEPGDNKTVTITNTYTPVVTPGPAKATLHVIKHVVNDNSGIKKSSDFKLYVKSADNNDLEISEAGSELGKTYTLDAGTYVVSEGAFDGYTASYSGSDSSGKITLAAGENKTVTITNNDVKPVVTDSGSDEVEQPEVSDTTVVTPAVPVKTTVTGGTLPDTSTNLYELLIMGAALTMLGALGWISRKRFE
jgi:LPXTG-motif cell wall-anchored protein